MSNQPPKRPRPAHPGSAPESQHGAEQHEHDDLIAVPKGQSKLSFYLKIGLVMFVLITFVVPGALMDALTSDGSSADGLYLSWTGPDGERREIDATEFVMHKRDLKLLDDTSPYRQARGMGNLSLLGLAAFDPKDDLATARFLILEDLAQSEGIRITPEELGFTIQNLFGGTERYRAMMQAERAYLTPVEFERILRRALLVRRFLGFVAAGAATADPARVAARWQAENQEYAFQYVQIPVAGFEEEARAALPADEELESWFNARPERDKRRFDTPVRWSAEFAYVPLPEDPKSLVLDTLLAKYPTPSDQDPEQLLQSYYETQRFIRFKRPEPLDSVEDAMDKLYFPRAEVEERVQREAPVHAALVRWHQDVMTRAAAHAGGAEGALPVDLGAEAAELGLVHVDAGVLRSQADWLAAEMPWGGKESRIVSRMPNLAAGQLVPSVFLDERAMVVARIAEKVLPGPPPFAEIRDRVAEEWVQQKRSELAVQRLELVRDQLGPRPPEPAAGEVPVPFEPVVDAETFAAAVAAAGFELRWRDHAPRDPMRLASEGEPPINELLGMNPLYFSVEEGEVPPARADRTGANAFLVRFAGKRDPDLSKMKPSDLENIRRAVESESVQAFFSRTFESVDFLKERYQLFLRDLDARSKPGDSPS